MYMYLHFGIYEASCISVWVYIHADGHTPQPVDMKVPLNAGKSGLPELAEARVDGVCQHHPPSRGVELTS